MVTARIARVHMIFITILDRRKNGCIAVLVFAIFSANRAFKKIYIYIYMWVVVAIVVLEMDANLAPFGAIKTK